MRKTSRRYRRVRVRCPRCHAFLKRVSMRPRSRMKHFPVNPVMELP